MAGSPSVKVFQCPECGSGITLRAMGQSVNAICPSCGSTIDVTNENYKIILKAKAQMNVFQDIPLGQRGKIRGETWEAIGFMKRSTSDGGETFSWCEYLLFNPFKGFRWLVESDGHWNFVLMTKDKPIEKQNNQSSVSYLGNTYQLYERGKAKVTYVVGEFYWRVRVGETVSTSDYISPPFMLSKESSSDETVWSLGEYIEPDLIKTAFSIAGPMPVREGVSPNQPSPTLQSWPKLLRYWAILAAGMTITQFIFADFFNHQADVYTKTSRYFPLAPEKERLSSKFEITGRTSAVKIELSSSIKNNWLGVQGELVEDLSGKKYPFNIETEYYTGFDDGPWSEGSSFGETLLSSIPPGTYHLNFLASGPDDSPPVLKTDLHNAVPENAKTQTELWPNGQPKQTEYFVDGKRQGLAKYYFQNGKIQFEGPYSNDLKHGVFNRYHEDGILAESQTYANDQLDGVSKTFNADGSIDQATLYVQGIAKEAKDPTVQYYLSVKSGYIGWSNYVISLFLVSIFPFFVWLRKRSFEHSRRLNSNVIRHG